MLECISVVEMNSIPAETRIVRQGKISAMVRFSLEAKMGSNASDEK